MGAPWAGLGPVGSGGAVGAGILSRGARAAGRGVGWGGARAWGAGSEGCGPLPGAGLGSSRHAPRPHAARLTGAQASRLHRLHSRGAGQGRDAAAETQCAGRAGLPTDAPRPGCRGLFIAPGHHVGGVAGDRRATRLVVAPTPAA